MVFGFLFTYKKALAHFICLFHIKYFQIYLYEYIYWVLIRGIPVYEYCHNLLSHPDGLTFSIFHSLCSGNKLLSPVVMTFTSPPVLDEASDLSTTLPIFGFSIFNIWSV